VVDGSLRPPQLKGMKFAREKTMVANKKYHDYRTILKK
jgi:hypothetical protein